MKIQKMEEIAKKAGVSQSTVSRVINGNKTVSHELREKVMRIVRETGYTPNATAQSLARKKSLLIGIVLPDIANPFFSEMLNLIEADAKLNGYNIIFCNSEGNPQVEKQDIKNLTCRQIDGIIICPVNVESKYLENLREINIPIVMITRKVEGFDSVSTSHITGGELIGKYFAVKGFKSVGYIGNKDDDKYKGFRNQIDNFGIEFNDEFYFECHDGNQFFSNELRKKLEGTIKKMGRITVDAIFAYNDMAALNAINIFNSNGYNIPNDIAIAGFDNTYLSYELHPNITTIAQPMEEMVKIAIEKLLSKIESKGKWPIEVENIVLNPRLIVRNSTG